LGTGALKRLCQEFKEVTIPKGRSLYNEGAESEYLYIVIKGDFRVQKRLRLSREEVLLEEPGMMIEHVK